MRILITAILLVGMCSFVISAVVAETALHPLILRRSSDTAALAQSSAHTLGGEAHQMRLAARDGTVLKAWWITPPHWNGSVVIACHGVADSGFGVMGGVLLFAGNGYAVLAPDSRGHGESGGFVTYGITEAADLLEWSQWLRQQGASRIYGFGESLGGAILIQALGRAAPFDAIIAESSYAYFEQIARERVVKYGHVPDWTARVLVQEALLYLRLRYGVDLSKANPADSIRDTSVPVLLIHGLADKETYPVHSQLIYQSAQGHNRPVQLWLVPGAGHTGAYAQAPREFEARVLHFYASAKR